MIPWIWIVPIFLAAVPIKAEIMEDADIQLSYRSRVASSTMRSSQVSHQSSLRIGAMDEERKDRRFVEHVGEPYPLLLKLSGKRGATLSRIVSPTAYKIPVKKISQKNLSLWNQSPSTLLNNSIETTSDSEMIPDAEGFETGEVIEVNGTDGDIENEKAQLIQINSRLKNYVEDVLRAQVREIP